jgi:hypothetical protein
LCHSRGLVSTPAPATAISIALHLDHYVHILLAQVIHCPLTDIFKVSATGCNHMNYSKDFLLLGFMRMIMVMAVSMIMDMPLTMTVVVVAMAMAMTVAVAVAMIVGMSTAVMARVIMSMVTARRRRAGVIKPELWHGVAHNPSKGTHSGQGFTNIILGIRR